ncbi:MAG: anti-sigma factor RsbA family regulatory protein [Nocardioidaceae bacterium]
MSIAAQPVETFRHQAAFYDGLDDMVEQVAPFLQCGVDSGQPVLVAELPDRVAALRDALGADADSVAFVDMEMLGRNPARIIGAWREFVTEHPEGTSLRGVGEPVWASRREVELEECRLHEALLNVAFDHGPAWDLLCPYDAAKLPAAVLEDAMRTHPVIGPDRAHDDHATYGGHPGARALFSRALSEPPPEAQQILFDEDDLGGLRGVVSRLGEHAGVPAVVVEDLVLATHEVAVNSVRHGGGAGVLRSWRALDSFVLEVGDDGVIEDMLVGREPVVDVSETGRGVWLANQLCDLVQVRSSALGTTVRIHTWL